MSIVSSSIAVEAAQKDGRFWVAETHIDNLGIARVIRYLAAVGLNTAAVMAARAITLAADLVAQETTANVALVTSLGSLASPTSDYSTLASQLPALRTAYLTATQTQAIMIGDFLSSLTSGQLQTIFSMTSGQVTTLRSTKLTPAATAAATIRASTGA